MKIEITNLKKVIKGTIVLDDINYTFSGGRIYGLCGKNGCGKTMLMRLIAGLIYPSSGTIRIKDKVLGKDISFPESVGMLIENPSFLNDYTGKQNLEMLAGLQKNVDKAEVRRVLEQVGLDPDDKRKFYKYSLGMRQRLGIAAAIMGSPELILLDEPINAIDTDGVQEIRAIIRGLSAENRIIIVASHDKSEMDYLADEKIYMSEGRLIKETENDR
ncbi:ATP-binding cassette domain-containing protein [Coprococcus eutactus]|jgi:ABC-2 type transport system ATP-binding protein|uniref:ATP-binding cassette domain-containing protein n=1 Tax=Coprococcus hominis (ex Liu et al. 2022) TaxID=2763039 RepID=A0A8I0AND4_9FIRM|nr:MULTISPECIES: ATP-binding cassette domain-containing protein [Clostridia]RGH08488.1 ATP-binding cassette domain-containing protein [Clostridium sp. AF15-31]MBC5661955.1 ATP-binding cassette domain-containing protein [Coprococcus hominis (ex Liu et al. 2022)]MCB5504422.1 ATP-binding cassette domain-containing protein [Coprococcus eutactus]NSC96230.1 ATP-binding cassette domain-containing protein [Coprococcus eutactus]NSD35362.1 ATP-binding cassette domain-containing protein [Coprococcus euta